MLIEILKRLGSNVYTNKLHNELNILLSRVLSEHGLNTGGTFEWVDSILVKVSELCGVNILWTLWSL